MKKYKLSNFYKGWFIGNFEPSLFKTKEFELGLLFKKKGSLEKSHYHAIATEYNLLVTGSMSFKGELLEPGDIFIIEAGETSEVVFHEDCQLVCFKIPSIPGDKYEVL